MADDVPSGRAAHLVVTGWALESLACVPAPAPRSSVTFE